MDDTSEGVALIWKRSIPGKGFMGFAMLDLIHRTLRLLVASLIVLTVACGNATAAQAPPPAITVVQPVTPLVAVPRGWKEPRHPNPPATTPDHRIPSDPTQRCPQFEQAFRRHGLTPVQTFSYIAWRESRCRIKAINGRWNRHGKLVWTLNANKSVDRGIFQVNSSWVSVTRKVCGGPLDLLLTLDCNLKVAKYLLDNGGLAHWSLG